MHKKLTLLVGICLWLSGVVAGVLLVARWMSMGLHKAQTPATPTPVPGVDPVPAEPTAEPEPEGQHGLHRFSDPIKAGAKADMVRVRHACTRVSHRVASTIGRESKNPEASPVEATAAETA